MNRRRMPRCVAGRSTRPMAGFTLLEVLVAIAIFALASAMAYGSLDQVLRARDRLEEERGFWQALTLVMLRLEQDIGQARNRGVRDTDGRLLPPLQGQPADSLGSGAPGLELTHGGVLLSGEGLRSDLQRVAYRLEDGVLKRYIWGQLDRAPRSQPIETPLLTGVEEFRARFYDPNGAWTDTWPPPATAGTPAGQQPEPPRGVEIRLTLTGRGEFTRLFVISE